MSYTSLAALAFAFPIYLLVGLIIGIYQVISKLGLYFAAGFQYEGMFITVVNYVFMWPIMFLPDWQRKKHNEMMNETQVNDMNARWLLLRMAEGESVYTISKRLKIEPVELSSLIRLQALDIKWEDAILPDYFNE